MAPLNKHRVKSRNKKPTAVVIKSRKELRKEKRKEKKAAKAFYYQNRNEQFSNSTKTDKLVEPNEQVKSKKQKSIAVHDRLQEEYIKEKKQHEQLQRDVEKNRHKQLKEDNKKEDKMIKDLEKKLKLNKRKSKSIPKSFVSDGLDYLLDICDENNRKLAVETEKQLLGADSNSDSDDEYEKKVPNKYNYKNDILPIKKKESATKRSNEAINEVHEFSADEDIFDNLDVSMDSDFSNETEEHMNINQVDEEKEEDGGTEQEEDDNFIYTDSDGNDEKVENSDEDEHKVSKLKVNRKNNETKNDVWEDIYGRKRDADGKIIFEKTEKYIPPAARIQTERDAAKNEKLSRLKRQLKGLINRLSEHNMHTIVSQIEELYMSNPRNDMNNLLSTLIIEAIVGPILKPERLIMEHVMLMVIIHANVGNEVGAHFLQHLIKLYDEMSKARKEVEDKELDSIILMLAHLYNFKVIGSPLLYQILETLCEKFMEKEIELILVILKTVGFSLRKDDPVALKELILQLQRKAASTESNNLRVKFMLETMMAIKNNNMNKIPQYDPSHIEHLKKLLKSFVRRGNSITPFNIGLKDLLEADKRGRWWIIGSAWSGKEDVKKKCCEIKTEESFSEKLLELARKQRMNTDTRRNIFCTLMSAEDYMDAFEKLHRLGLKGQQEREIVYVIIDCCLQEKQYNHFYAVLAQQFCDYDRKYKMTVQYALWDKLQILQNYTGKQIINLSRFLTYLFIENGLPLSVLKVVQLGELDKCTMKFLKHIMLGLLLHENVEACLKAFEKITLSSQLKHFRDGLRLFINHFLIKNLKPGAIPEEKIECFQQRTELVDKILSARNSKVIF